MEAERISYFTNARAPIYTVLSTNTLAQCIASKITVSKEAITTVEQAFEPQSLAKGAYFLQSGARCKKMAFIVRGYVRMYNVVDGTEVTLWVGGGGRFITSVSSFVFETPNIWEIQAITDCELLVISRKNHFDLCQKEPKWLEFDNLLLASAFTLLEQRMFAHLHTTAKERLLMLLEDEPELFLHVPHQYIASMLGITPESLSRLRKGLSKVVS